MTNTTKKTTIALAASAALTAGLALSPMTVSADVNPFGNTELSSGYMQLAESTNKDAEGKCGEAKCGADKKAEKMKEAKCGADKKAAHEAKCGADKKAAHEAKCGSEMKEKAEKMKEGKCGADK
ncbi:hypothetical protein LCGC14_0600300 [marine sediment metagenome]|uniref:Low-complexity protein n=1 Tax=marine sediment metagenome TaxID=412755 RepID=A0A0F9UJ64_9ZZZZ|nr:low-complexity protein [Methylophaga sp.]HEC58339.1 low-complexity protein [Methylophaga sp.]